MAADRQRRHIGHHPAEDALDRRRLAVADRVGEHDRVGPRFGGLDRDATHPLFVDRPFDCAAERGGEPAGQARALVLGRGMAQCDDAAEILDRLGGRAADVGAVVPLADRQHVIHFVDAQRQAALGTFEVRDQRRHGEPRQSQRVTHDRFGVGELRQQFWRDKRGDLDLAHPGGVLGVEPGQLLLGRHDLGEALQAVAHADLADKGTFAHFLLPMMLSQKANPPASSGQRSGKRFGATGGMRQPPNWKMLAGSSVQWRSR